MVSNSYVLLSSVHNDSLTVTAQRYLSKQILFSLHVGNLACTLCTFWYYLLGTRVLVVHIFRDVWSLLSHVIMFSTCIVYIYRYRQSRAIFPTFCRFFPIHLKLIGFHDNNFWQFLVVCSKRVVEEMTIWLGQTFFLYHKSIKKESNKRSCQKWKGKYLNCPKWLNCLGAVHKLCRLKISNFWPPPPS